MSILPRILGVLLLVLASSAQDFDRVRAGAATQSLDSMKQVLPTPPAPVDLGKVTLREGFLARLEQGRRDWLDAPLHSQVQQLDRVRTGKDSRAEIQFHARNVLRLAPATTLSLEKLSQEEEDAALEVDVVVEEGGIWAELDALEEQDVFSVRTPVMGAAITGTAFTLDVDKEGVSTLEVIHGEVRVGKSNQRPDPQAPAIGLDSLRQIMAPRGPQPVKGAPQPVAGPHAVAGPREVSLEEWLVIVKDQQRLRIGPGGRVLEAGEARPRKDAWHRWNKERNTQGH